MRYPTLTKSKCAELAAQLAAGEDSSIDPHVAWVGRGNEVNLQPVSEAAREMTRKAHEWTDDDRDRFEGGFCIRLFEALRHVPTEVLDDRGFWRFISLRFFWEFIAWREEEAFSSGSYLKYVNCATNTESVLPRMYLRARAVGGSTHSTIASAIPRGTDFWRSHVIRVRTGSAPPVTRAFAMRQAEDRLTTDPLRQAARRLNRTWANVVLHVYDDGEASAFVGTIWDNAD